MDVNFAKYGDELSDQQMRQFLSLDDIDMNRSSKKATSVEDQEALKRMENSVHVVEKCNPLVAKQQANGISKIAVFKEKATTWQDVP